MRATIGILAISIQYLIIRLNEICCIGVLFVSFGKWLFWNTLLSTKFSVQPQNNNLCSSSESCSSKLLNSFLNLQFQSTLKIFLQTWATWKNVSAFSSVSLAGLSKILSFRVTFSCGCRGWWGSEHDRAVWSNMWDEFREDFLNVYRVLMLLFWKLNYSH